MKWIRQRALYSPTEWCVIDACHTFTLFFHSLESKFENLGHRNTRWNSWIKREAVKFFEKNRDPVETCCVARTGSKVRSPYGHVFERSILMKALEKRASCPLSETQRQCPTQEIWIDNRLCAAEWNCSKKLISAWNGIKMNQLRSVSLSMNTLSKRHQQHSASVQNFLK